MKPFIIFGWLEDPDDSSSARGGANDFILDSTGKPLSFASSDEAMKHLTGMTVPVVNVAQVLDLQTGKFTEFERKAWVPRQPKPPKPPKSPQKQQPPTAGGGGGGGNP